MHLNSYHRSLPATAPLVPPLSRRHQYPGAYLRPVHFTDDLARAHVQLLDGLAGHTGHRHHVVDVAERLAQVDAGDSDVGAALERARLGTEVVNLPAEVLVSAAANLGPCGDTVWGRASLTANVHKTGQCELLYNELAQTMPSV